MQGFAKKGQDFNTKLEESSQTFINNFENTNQDFNTKFQTENFGLSNQDFQDFFHKI